MNKNNKTRKKLFRLVLLVALLLFLLLVCLGTKQRRTTPSRFVTTNGNGNTEIKEDPAVENIESVTPYKIIVIDFNSDTNLTGVNISVEPSANVKITIPQQMPNRLIIQPKEGWVYNETYKVFVEGKEVKQFNLKEADIIPLGEEPTPKNLHPKN